MALNHDQQLLNEVDVGLEFRTLGTKYEAFFLCFCLKSIGPIAETQFSHCVS